MPLHDIATQLIQDTHQSLWPAFAPEIVLCLAIMAMLIIRVLPGGKYVPGFLLAIASAGTALYFASPWSYVTGETELVRQELFTGMLVLDGLTVFIRAFLLVFALLFAVMTRLTRNPTHEDSIDFYCLILGATLGMCLMASANHLLMVFLAVEMASVPSYALAGQLKSSRKSSEAALKYAVYGAGAAGVMLYGISLLAGILNTAHLPTMAVQLYDLMPMLPPEQKMVLALGGLMVMVGLAFKLSAVPFHFWCPDVFEGASAEVGAFLSIASKAGALALLVRVTLGLGVAPERETQMASTPAVSATVAEAEIDNGSTLPLEKLAAAADEPQSDAGEDALTDDRFATALAAETADSDETASTATGNSGDSDESEIAAAPYGQGPLAPVRNYIAVLVGVIAAVTCTFGNLAAYGQTNIKRLMGYSTIAHAGYMMMAVPPAIAVSATHPEIAKSAIASLILYAAIYLLMNLAAFSVIAFYRDWLGSEEISAYSGLVRRSPFIVIMFSLVLFSLVGLPPLAGFLGKFAVFAAIANAWVASDNGFLLALLMIGGVNTAVSLFYYLRVVKVMTIDPELDSSPQPSGSSVSLLAGTFIAILVVPIITLLVYSESLSAWTHAATKQLF